MGDRTRFEFKEEGYGLVARAGRVLGMPTRNGGNGNAESGEMSTAAWDWRSVGCAADSFSLGSLKSELWTSFGRGGGTPSLCVSD